MSKESDNLAKLARLAQIRSDLELKRFAAFRAHVTAVTTELQAHRDTLSDLYNRAESFSLEGARLANLDSGRLAQKINQLETELARLTPGFDQARHRAVQEFGRLQVLGSLSDSALQAGKKSPTI